MRKNASREATFSYQGATLDQGVRHLNGADKVADLGSASARLLEVALSEGRYGLVLFEAYLDESGCDDQSRVLSVGGYIIRSDRARMMDAAWRATLSKHNLPFFHTVDCAHGNGAFKGMPVEQRAAIQKEFIELAKRHTQYGVAAVAAVGRHEAVKGKIPDPYGFCVQSCIGIMMAKMFDHAKGAKLQVFLEAGHSSAPAARAFIDRIFFRKPSTEFSDMLTGYSFFKKADLSLLQAADLLVWQSAKRTKDLAFSERPARKDFISLMSLNASIAYAVFEKERFFYIVDDGPTRENKRRDQSVKEIFNLLPLTDPIAAGYFARELSDLAKEKKPIVIGTEYPSRMLDAIRDPSKPLTQWPYGPLIPYWE